MIKNLKYILNKINSANSILLTTHRHCDGDGLGAILGLYHGLKNDGRNVTAMTIDGIPKKYDFLNGHNYSLCYEKISTPLVHYDLCLVFDTNDHRLIEPLYTKLLSGSTEVLFVDHHPLLSSGPLPTEGSFIDTSAASTGEIAYNIIKSLGIKMNSESAMAIYTSICFDTQLFRFIKGSSSSHIICADLLNHFSTPEIVHQNLFSTYTVGKTKFLSEVLGHIELFHNDEIAFLLVTQDQLNRFNMEPDESRDVIDMVMNITSLESAVLFREEGVNIYKISLRSKGNVKVLDIAEKFNGGGHPYAAGALLKGPLELLKLEIINSLIAQIKALQTA